MLCDEKKKKTQMNANERKDTSVCVLEIHEVIACIGFSDTKYSQ